MKKSTLTILTTIIAFSPLTVLAQVGDTQTSIQNNTNSSAAVGDANLILQDADQANYQDQLNLDAYGVPDVPDTQTSVQGNANEAAAVGGYNVIDQDSTQHNVQGQIDVQQYIPSGYGY
ncbi:MAG: hypothetical protein AAF383_19355 [Cyanobacteria bacterium P01_A01_bin.83]